MCVCVYIYIYIHMNVYVWVYVCVHGWMAKEGILSLASVRVSRGTPLSILAQRSHKEVNQCLSFLLSALCFCYFIFSTTCEMPTWPGVRINNGVHTTRWSDERPKTNRTSRLGIVSYWCPRQGSTLKAVECKERRNLRILRFSFGGQKGKCLYQHRCMWKKEEKEDWKDRNMNGEGRNKEQTEKTPKKPSNVWIEEMKKMNVCMWREM